ncbi:uncharacterized protein [Arachis hypogaea]|uniref:uncharacterized protein n=1 Tax=Arachis hypogaea TaxID=3818 RepID=UPI000DED081E|nr:uncharacterized protein LOC112798342 [Arachis hypogaea]
MASVKAWRMFDAMPITDEASMQKMFQIHQQTQMRHPQIEVYVDFETVEAVAVQNDIDIHGDRDAVYQGMNSDSEDDFEATYEAGDEDEDGNVGVEAAAENVVVGPSSSQPMDVPPFMRELDLEAMHAHEFPKYTNIGVVDGEDGEFWIGMEYSSRKSVVAAIRSFTIGKGVDYEVYESEPQTFYAKCKMYGRGCDWLIRASLIRKKGCWEIRRYNGSHTCTIGTISQDHSKLDSDTVANAIRPLVETDPSIKVKSIIAEVQSRFNYTISYRKAWLAKQKSIANVFGGWEDSYQALPWWLSVMVQKMPGSVVQIETRPLYNGNEEAQGVKILHRVFWSFNSCIRAFRHCKPLVQVDGTHLYEKYKGTLLVAVAQDGTIILCLSPLPWWKGRQLMRVTSFSGICEWYSTTVEEYNINYKRLEERDEAYARWCDAIGLRHWVLTFDEGHRWGHMTTNLVECINSVLKGARNLPVLALVRATYYRLNELFTRKSAETHERKRAGYTYSAFAQQRIEASMQQAGNIVVHHFDRRNEVFEVREMTTGKVLVVDLARRTCDCGHFQVERIPCHHVIACCANQRLDWQLYVHDVYKMTEVRKVYKFEFTPLGDPDTWPPYEGPTLVANPVQRRTSKGRPKLTRYLNEMDSRDMRGPQICCLCGAQGHSQSRCPQRDGPSGAAS